LQKNRYTRKETIISNCKGENRKGKNDKKERSASAINNATIASTKHRRIMTTGGSLLDSSSSTNGTQTLSAIAKVRESTQGVTKLDPEDSKKNRIMVLLLHLEDIVNVLISDQIYIYIYIL